MNPFLTEKQRIDYGKLTLHWGWLAKTRELVHTARAYPSFQSLKWLKKTKEVIDMAKWLKDKTFSAVKG